MNGGNGGGEGEGGNDGGKSNLKHVILFAEGRRGTIESFNTHWFSVIPNSYTYATQVGNSSHSA